MQNNKYSSFKGKPFKVLIDQTVYDQWDIRSDKLWDERNVTLKHQNYNLNNELSKLKKNNNLLQQEKKHLELKVTKLEHQLKNSHKIKPLFPDDIKKLLEKVESNLQIELNSKLENLMSCITCVICYEKIKSIMYVGCRHLVACVDCNKNLGDQCPICKLNSKKVAIYH